MVAVRRRGRPKKDAEYWRCGEMWHWERDCEAARQRRTHSDRRDRQSCRDQQSDTNDDDDDDDDDESSDDEHSVAGKDNQPAKDKRMAIPAKESLLVAGGIDAWVGLTIGTTDWADLLGNQWAESKAAAATERIVEIAEAGETACETGTVEDARAVVETEIVETEWVTDSGATHHLMRRSMLKSARALETPVTFELAGGGTIKAVEVGEVDVVLSERRLTLQNVYHLPTARVSVCSLSRLLARGWHAEIKDDGGTLQREDERLTLRKRVCLWTVALKTTSPTALGYIAAARDVEADTAVRELQDNDECKAARSDDCMGAGGACDEKQAADTGQRKKARRQRTIDTVDTGTAAELGISPTGQSEIPLTKSPATAVTARRLEALGQESQHAAREDGYMRVLAINDDQETSGDTETMSRREAHPVIRPKRRNADGQSSHHQHHQQRFPACARDMRDCMHAEGTGGRHGGAELSQDTQIIQTGAEMTENGRIASEQPEGGRSLNCATSAAVVPGLYRHGEKIDTLQNAPETIERLRGGVLINEHRERLGGSELPLWAGCAAQQ